MHSLSATKGLLEAPQILPRSALGGERKQLSRAEDEDSRKSGSVTERINHKDVARAESKQSQDKPRESSLELRRWGSREAWSGGSREGEQGQLVKLSLFLEDAVVALRG